MQELSPLKFASETIPTGFMEDGAPVRLQLLIAKPDVPGPHPTLVFHHGSTGTARSPAMFRRAVKYEALARYFAARGWMTLFPQRRGRGKSDGLYDEGLRPGRIGYSCEPAVSLAGAARALADVAAITAHVKARPDVAAGRLLVGGASRGGALALAHAATDPDAFCGVVNFNGGWLGQGCPGYAQVNPVLFQRAATFRKPTVWLHGTKDNYYPIRHCRGIHDAFVAAGGRGDFHALKGGHMLVLSPRLWQPVLDRFLAEV